MDDPDFTGMGPFADDLNADRRGKLALRLTKACRIVPAAEPAALALGSLFDPEKRREAMQVLNGLSPVLRRHIMARYQSLSRLSGDGPC